MEQAKELGLEVALVTATVPHGLGTNLSDMLEQMGKAWKRLWQGRQGVQLRRTVGIFGHIRALEVTHGENGFHPHYHALVFYHPDQILEGAWQTLKERWQGAAVIAGLPRPSDDHGLRVDDGQKAAAYVSKGVWGLESELTKGHVKTGKKGSRTPYDLLRSYMEGDKAAGALWRVYVDAFEGKRQLCWSKGLKRLLAVAELTDNELANKPDEQPAVLLAVITDKQWRVIFKTHMESAVLDLAESCLVALREFLNRLEEDKPPERIATKGATVTRPRSDQSSSWSEESWL